LKLSDTPENRVVVATLTALAAVLDPMRNDIGCADYGTSRVPYGVGGRGGSDYICIIRPPHPQAGRFVAIEFKAPGHKPDLAKLDARIASKDFCPGTCSHERCRLVYQRIFHLRVIADGGIALFADCPADVLQALEAA
jgi:hypothetical protein